MIKTQPDIRIVSANSGHVPLILGFIRKLAEYEKLSDEVVATEEELHQYLFGAHPVAEVLLAYAEDRAVGFALFFTSFSTFLGRPGIYLEDLFVEVDARGSGAGKALLRRLAQLAVERGYGRLEWAVLNWNQPSIEFYRSLGARPLDEWTVYRVTGDTLNELAANGNQKI